MKKVFLGIYLLLQFTVVIISLGFDPLIHQLFGPYLKEQSDAYYRGLSRGVYSLLAADLERLPQEAWPERIRELQVDFGYPLELLPCIDCGLAVEELELMMAGSIVVNSGGTLFHKRIDGSDYVLRMTTPEPELTTPWKLVMWGLAAFLLTPFALAWSLPFYRHLSRIRRAAIEFGNGRLDLRVKIPARSSLSAIGLAFNDMADRIVQLITAQKELIRAVSHELRTPISRIRFGLEMAAYNPDREAQSRYLAGIEEDIDELDSLVAELLTYNRLDHHEPVLNLEEHKLLPWVERIVSDVDRENTRKTLTFKTSLGSEQASAVMDHRLMGRAIRNLVQNAARYATNLVEVEVSEKDGSCTIHIDDNGPGIEEKDRERIFEPFVRLDPSRDRDSGGHGLGLAIVRQVAALHSGAVMVGSSPLGGARFTLRWPSCRKSRKS